MKRRATLLLVAATVLFIVTRALESRFPWLGIVGATAEAAMVGGLADWFAVTALFRHPLGIPIPHTAIVPARKDRVGRTLGAFVQRNFLSRDVIEHRLRSSRSAGGIAEWLAEPDNARTIARNAAAALSSAAQMLARRRRPGRASTGVSRSACATMHLAPLLGKVLGVITDGQSSSGGARRGDRPRLAHREREQPTLIRAAHRAGDAVVDSVGGRRQDLQARARAIQRTAHES